MGDLVSSVTICGLLKHKQKNHEFSWLMVRFSDNGQRDDQISVIFSILYAIVFYISYLVLYSFA